MVLSDPAKSGLESGAWIDECDYQNKNNKKHYHYEETVCYFFFGVVYQNKPM